MADIKNMATEAAAAAEDARNRARLAEKALDDERARMAAEVAGYERRLANEHIALPKQTVPMVIDDEDTKANLIFSRPAAKSSSSAATLTYDNGKGRLEAPQTPVFRRKSGFNEHLEDDVIELTSDDDEDTIKMKVLLTPGSAQPKLSAGGPSTPVCTVLRTCMVLLTSNQASRAAPIPHKRSPYGKPTKGLPATPQKQGVAKAAVHDPVSLTFDEVRQRRLRK